MCVRCYIVICCLTAQFLSTCTAVASLLDSAASLSDLLDAADKAGFTEGEKLQIKRLHFENRIYPEKTDEEIADFMHKYCYKIGAGGRIVEPTHPSLRRKTIPEWASIQAEGWPLSEQAAYWHARALIATRSGDVLNLNIKNPCVLYHNAYENAPADMKPNVYDFI